MTRTATKILALGSVLATASPALANPNETTTVNVAAAPALPATWDAAAQAKQTIVKIGGTPYLISLGTAPVAVSMAELGRFLGETEPLTGPRGPACGNVLSKSMSPCERERRDALAKRRAAEAKKAAALNKPKPIKPQL